ncbi:LemA family protein [Saxibacter everestensis]|uniref:LemA family protein n=1 Tax=Saxibacter everestensis TaxID=2909229 RepID=A0ABY8QVC6_9MICO|nr:LemA family protein [Brevibacteriaceae bacterium ZFBP1038]
MDGVIFGVGGALVLTLIIGLVVAGVLGYNRLSMLNDLVGEARRQLERTLAQRHEIVPDFLAAVRRDGNRSTALIESVMSVRERALSAGTLEERGQLEQEFSGVLLGVGPDRARTMRENRDEAGSALRHELVRLDGRIAASARYYNVHVERFNARRNTLTGRILGSRFAPASTFPFRSADNERRGELTGNVPGVDGSQQ